MSRFNSKKKYNNVIWTERMNSMDRNRKLKVKKRQVAGLKGAFVICEVSNKLTNLKNSKDISDRELRFSLIKTCSEFLVFLGTAKMKGNNIGRQYLPNILSPKFFLLTKDESNAF